MYPLLVFEHVQLGCAEYICSMHLCTARPPLLLSHLSQTVHTLHTHIHRHTCTPTHSDAHKQTQIQTNYAHVGCAHTRTYSKFVNIL